MANKGVGVPWNFLSAEEGKGKKLQFSPSGCNPLHASHVCPDNICSDLTELGPMVHNITWSLISTKSKIAVDDASNIDVAAN